MTYILYNPHAGSGGVEEAVRGLAQKYEESKFFDVTEISKNENGYDELLEGVCKNDSLIICGGDGTLNRFANDIAGYDICCPIYYYAIGSGNDFARDLGKSKGDITEFPINQYVTDLPTVSLDNMEGERYFVNGIGYGIDGYCCDMGDAIRAENEKNGTDKKIDYTAIAIKGLLFKYKPTSAVVTVDGKEYSFKKVWIAPAMNGRFYGGGFMPTPNQKRIAENGEERKISLMVFHDSGKLKTLMTFPAIFKGEHIKDKKHVTVFEGKEIKVEFDSPRALQIDGETVRNVKYYVAKAPVGIVSAEEKKSEAEAFETV